MRFRHTQRTSCVSQAGGAAGDGEPEERFVMAAHLFVFFYASVHLSLWFVDWWFDWAAMGEELVKKRYIFIGMLTFLILLPLAITSTNGWIRRLGKRWTKLHRLVSRGRDDPPG